MSVPLHAVNWKRYQPRDLKDAFRACKDRARDEQRLSVERIADLLGCSADALYKWMGDARMPAAMIPGFEHVCRAHYVSDYLAAGQGRIVIQIPPGHPADIEDLAGLQSLIADSVAQLVRCYRGQAAIDATQRDLTQSLQGLGWHRENVAHLTHPELDLGGDDHA